MKIIDLFCGIGGLSLGFEQVGFEVVAAIDMWKDAVVTYNHNRKDKVAKVETVEDFNEKELLEIIASQKITGIIGGPPCQGFSTVGRREVDDPRNKMYLEFYKAVKIANPDFFVIENVKGMLTLNKGAFVKDLIERFGPNGLGYNISYQLLNAADYGIPQNHKVTVQTAWSNYQNSDPIADIRALKKTIRSETGVVCTRAMCDSTVLDHIMNNEKIKTAIFALRSNIGEITEDEAIRYVENRTKVRIYVNDYRYADESGTAQAFMPADTFVMFPDGNLGKTWFGTTPAESDLMSGAAANVAITDTGVAVVTTKKVDPVQVETIVSMICLPSFEQANHIGIIDITP